MSRPACTRAAARAGARPARGRGNLTERPSVRALRRAPFGPRPSVRALRRALRSAPFAAPSLHTDLEDVSRLAALVADDLHIRPGCLEPSPDGCSHLAAIRACWASGRARDEGDEFAA